MAVLFVGFLLEKLRVIHVTLVIWFLHLLLKEVSKVSPQKVPKRREFIRRIPKNPIRKTPCSNISLESTGATNYRFSNDWTDKEHGW